MSNKFVRKGVKVVFGREAGGFYNSAVFIKKSNEGFGGAEIDSKIIIHINILAHLWYNEKQIQLTQRCKR